MNSDKSRRKSFRSGVFILLTSLVVVLSIVAVAISINITSIMFKKQDQLANGKPVAVAGTVKNSSELSGLVNIKKAERRPVFLNGRQLKDLVYYDSDSGKSLLPIDVVMKYLGAQIGLINSDDTFTASIDTKKLMLKLGTGEANAWGTALKLDTASFAAENHVLASPVILDTLEGFKLFSDVGNKTAFAYYWPSSESKKYSGVRLFGLNGRGLEISGLFGEEKPYSYSKTGLAAIDEAVYSASSQSLLARCGEQYFLINSKNYKKPVRLDMDGSWRIAEDGSFLWRLDESEKIIRIYDVKSSSIKKVKDIYSAITLRNGVSLTESKLLEYEIGKKFTRLDFEGLDGDVHTVISRSGKLIVQGSSSYSPDHRWLLLYDRSDGWSMSGMDGRNIVRFKDASSARWVDNDRVLLQTAGGFEVYEAKDASRHVVEVPFYHVGEAADGRLFFAKGNELFVKKGAFEKRIALFPWRYDYACSASAEGPVVIVTGEGDGIFVLTSVKTEFVGKLGLFPNRPAAGEQDKGFNRNAAFSPDGSKLAILQMGERFLEVKVSGLKELKQESFTLGYSPGSHPENPVINVSWVGNSSLLVHTADRSWLISFNGDKSYIYDWSMNASIAGYFQPTR